MSYSPQGSPPQDSYPQSGKPVGGYRGEDLPQRGKSRRHQQQQQASPVMVLPQRHDLPESITPDNQSSHQNSHHHQQQQSIPLGVPSSSGYPQKDHYPESHSSLPGYQGSHNQPHQQQPVRVLSQGCSPKDSDLSNHQSPTQSHKQVITSIQDPSPQQSHPKDYSSTHRLPSEISSKTQQLLTTGEAPLKLRNPSESSGENHMDPQKNENPTSSGEKHLSRTVDQQRNYHSLQYHTNGFEQKPNPPWGLFQFQKGTHHLGPQLLRLNWSLVPRKDCWRKYVAVFSYNGNLKLRLITPCSII